MTDSPGIYRWDAEAELVTAQPDEAAIYYEWLLGLPAGSRPGEALRRVGVSEVRAVGGGSGWIPTFFVDDIEAAIARLRPGIWNRTDVADGVYIVDEQGSSVRLRERSSAQPRGAVTFDYSARDVRAAAEFYSRLLGLDALEVIDDTYDMRFLSDGQGIAAGVFQLGGIERRTVWITYFEVESLEEFVARAVQSGSRVRIPPVDSPINRYAVLDDPWGNLYGFSSMFAGERMGPVLMRGPSDLEPKDYVEILLRGGSEASPRVGPVRLAQ